MDDQEIQQRIQELVEEEKELRGSDAEEHQQQLRKVQEELDQCWDLVRQRRAKADAGENPDDVAVRPVDEVESYRQ